jgi:hypothetical protein
MEIKPIKAEEIVKGLQILSRELMCQAVNNLLRKNYDDYVSIAVIKESEIIAEYLKVTGQDDTREIRKAIYEKANGMLAFEEFFEDYWEILYIAEIEPVDNMYEPYYMFTNIN